MHVNHKSFIRTFQYTLPNVSDALQIRHHIRTFAVPLIYMHHAQKSWKYYFQFGPCNSVVNHAQKCDSEYHTFPLQSVLGKLKGQYGPGRVTNCILWEDRFFRGVCNFLISSSSCLKMPISMSLSQGIISPLCLR